MQLAWHDLNQTNDAMSMKTLLHVLIGALLFGPTIMAYSSVITTYTPIANEESSDRRVNKYPDDTAPVRPDQLAHHPQGV